MRASRLRISDGLLALGSKFGFIRPMQLLCFGKKMVETWFSKGQELQWPGGPLSPTRASSATPGLKESVRVLALAFLRCACEVRLLANSLHFHLPSVF